MKKVFKLTLTLAMILSATTLFGQKEKVKEEKRYEHFKERDISKTYPATGNSLNIENSFGAVKVSTWNKNEIKVDVHIEASSDNKEHADNVFANIDVSESKEGNKINFKTIIKNHDRHEWCKNCKSNMRINYTIQIPSGNKLDINNSFGSTEIPDFSGPLSIVSKFGSLQTGKLSKAEKLQVEFGSADIESINNANAVFKFSSLKIENLSGSAKLNIEFCNPSRIILNNDLKSLNIKQSYSTINLKPVTNFSASYNIQTNFGSFKNKTDADIKRTDTPDKYGPDSKKNYEGKSGNGNVKIDVNSNFGTIILGDASEEEMKQKNKEKTKERKNLS